VARRASLLAAPVWPQSDPGMRSCWPLLVPALFVACSTTSTHLVDPKTDVVVSVAAVADQLATADVVAFGELHETPPVHELHHQLLAALHQRRPDLVVAMEHFERDVQNVVLQYIDGSIDEATFLAKSRPWKTYARDYKPVVEFCKQHKLVLLAANAPRPLAAKASREGLAGVQGNPHVARESTAPEDDYWDSFVEQMKGHPGVTDAMVRNFYVAQCLKDDTMAESITDQLQKYPVGKRPLVVFFCGRTHSDHRLGTVARIEGRMPGLAIKVLSAETIPDAAPGIYSSPRKIADFVVVAPESKREPASTAQSVPAVPVAAGPAAPAPAPVPAHPPAAAAAEGNPEGQRPALGLMPDYAEGVDGILVSSVREGGAAEQAGMQAGDIIILVNGVKVTDPQSYSDVLDEQRIGKTIPVRVKRGDAEVELQVKVGSRPAR
jgi:uncharacterized iron-regulated protein